MPSQKQSKSIEILKKFVAETPVNEVQALVDKYAQLEVDSPTMTQLLVLFKKTNITYGKTNKQTN